MNFGEARSILRSNFEKLIQIVNNQEMDRIQTAMNKADEAMGYRVPKTPVPGSMNSYTIGHHSTQISLCPECGNLLMTHYNCCPNCGQVLDWSDLDVG